MKKSISIIDESIRDYVSKSSIFFLATSSLERKADVSPRGDEPGFVKILDEKHLAFPDRPGNRTGLAVVLEAEKCFVHCPQAFKQAGICSHDQWILKEEHPNTSEMFKVHLAINGWK